MGLSAGSAASLSDAIAWLCVPRRCMHVDGTAALQAADAATPGGPASHRVRSMEDGAFGLLSEQLPRFLESDPLAFAVETAILEFLPSEFDDVDIAMMDRREEAGVERLNLVGNTPLGIPGVAPAHARTALAATDAAPAAYAASSAARIDPTEQS